MLAPRRHALSPLTAELLVAGALTVVHARLKTPRRRQLNVLLNPLMSMIVLPYLGPGAASRELTRAAPQRPVTTPTPTGDPIRSLKIRLTPRTASVLEAVALGSGASNVEIAERAGVTDQGQISKLLARLGNLMLIENTGPPSRGTPNAWRLTPTGKTLDCAIRGDPAGHTHPSRHDG